jgi:hypothetical protein
MSEMSYDFTLGLGPATAVPALGVLERGLVALLIPGVALFVLGRRSRSRAPAGA